MMKLEFIETKNKINFMDWTQIRGITSEAKRISKLFERLDCDAEMRIVKECEKEDENRF